MLFPRALFAVGTPAGTVISNQATAAFRYADDSSVTIVSSNIVTITVAQLAAVNLTPASAGQATRLNDLADYPFSVVNSGNGTDRFSLSWTSSLGLSAELYRDSNGDELLTSGEIAAGAVSQTGEMSADASMDFILRLSVPDDAALVGQADVLTLACTSAFDPAARGTLVRSTTVTGAVLMLRSSVSTTIPRAGDRIMYTLEYRNSGNGAANEVEFTDALDSRLRFVTGSASPAPDTIAGQILRWRDMAIPAGTTGTITFQAEIMNNVAGGMEIHNFAMGQYRDGPNPRSVAGIEVNFMTVQSSGLVPVDLAGDTSGTGEAGDTLEYRFAITNNGALPEQFALSATSTFGLGWTFYEDPAGLGIVEADNPPITSTGELQAGARYRIVARTVLPVVAMDQTVDFTTIRVQSTMNQANFRTATGSTTIGIPQMSLSKEATSPDAFSGAEITYTITYVNTGHGRAYAFSVTDTIPANTMYIVRSARIDGNPMTDEADQDAVTVSGGVLSVAPGTIEPNEKGTIEFRVRIL